MLSRAQRVAAIVAGVLALLAPLLLVRISPTTAYLRVLLDASHGAIFAGVAVLLALLRKPKREPAGAGAWPDWAGHSQVLTICVALGAFIEFLQGFEGRPPSLFDVMTDTAGALAGLSIWTLATRPATGQQRAATRASPWHLIALGIAGITFVMWRPIQAATAYAHRAAIFPAIAEFNRPLDRYFTTADGVAVAITELPAPWSRLPGERAIELRYAPGHPPDVQIVEPQGDWRGYHVIAADLTNAGPTELALVFRVFDAHHDWSDEDRLNLPLVIPPRTRTTVRVSLEAVEAAPASRRMDIARIANVMLFGNTATASGALYVSRIWLE